MPLTHLPQHTTQVVPSAPTADGPKTYARVIGRGIVTATVAAMFCSCGGSVDSKEGNAEKADCDPFAGGELPTAIDIDWDCDGTINWRACDIYTYDARGNVLTSRSGCDNPPLCLAFKYDEGGKLLSETWDNDCDGVINRCIEYAYGTDPRRREFGIDKGCNGVIDTCVSESFDACGNSETYFVDVHCDGTPDECHTMVWTGDTYTQTVGCGVVPDYCSTGYVDERGWPTQNDHDEDCDGTVDDSTCYEYHDGAGSGGTGGTGGTGGMGSGGTGGIGTGGTAGSGGVGGMGGTSGTGGSGGLGGSGGSPSCTAPADQCPGTQVLLSGTGAEPRTGSGYGTTSGTCSDYEGSCSSPGTPDAVYWFTSDVDGMMSVGVQGDSGTWFPFVYVRTSCDDATTELLCELLIPTTPILVQAGTVYFVIVEGPPTGESYELGVKIIPQ